MDTKVKYSIYKQVNYYNLSLENFNYSTSLNKIVEPEIFDEASKDIRWVEAINLEMEALNRNGTWVITELPVVRKPICSKWVFKVKYKSTGEVERFKARLVAKGYNQKEGIDYEEKISHVVTIVTVRKSVARYVVLMGKNLVSWKSKKQSMLSKSSAEAKYKAMNSVTCEVIWILKVLAELNIDTSLPVPLR
ncbi:ribonuclease H-like domain-containing protein [Tanacetum coccineum]